ncbi:MAG: hypothetical protein ACYTE5_10690 [Planctomycetota bacterium]|jgi:hypothetical protein
MRKVKIEQLQEWFDDPEAELEKFMNSGQAIMGLMFPGSKRPIELNQRDVGNLLAEFRAMDWNCSYCRNVNMGKEDECVGCGVSRR